MTSPRQLTSRVNGSRRPASGAARAVVPAPRPGDDPSAVLPMVVTLDDADTPYDVVDALAVAEFAAGRQPWARTRRLDRIRKGARLLPRGATVVRTAVEEDREVCLAVGPGWTLRAVRWRSGGGEVTVTATDEKLGRSVLKKATKGAEAEPVVEDGTVTVGFWFHSPQRGPYRTTRSITAEPWEGIRANYAAGAAEAFDRLMKQTSDDVNGRLILLHGPPGTGKTTALRALAREWREWCRMDCVLDPEALFGDTGYLMDVAIGRGGSDDDDKEPWRLLVLEDCDELIRGEAKRSTGQALSRLLNLTDGLLGQGRKVLVAITTNESLDSLHPAVVRPGRCMAQIEVGALSQAEAAAWLGPDAAEAPAGPATLAELFALRNGSAPVEVPEAEAPVPGGDGMYL